ncbi:MAG: DUF1830 domain-containing protein [Microcoleus anatoxicus]|jgi:hypothetical protein|uniref:DUF1830 domain-containing protein n=1 Tax=Microcoleus TaxID=44471 RepID=UPI00312B8F5D
MNLTINSVNSDPSVKILCWYINTTNKIQIARITNIPDWYFERTVFPGERLLFEAPQHAELEVSRSTESGAIVCDRIGCDRLQVEEVSTLD